MAITTTRTRLTRSAALLAMVSLVAAGCGQRSTATGDDHARVVAVGDIACGTPPARHGAECRYGDVADVVIDERPDLFLALGDTQYGTPDGTIDFRFYDEAFGSLRPITLPTAGDEDWTADREAFLDYFGGRTTDTGYDSTVIAGWHVIVLNSQDCFDADGCKEGSPQLEWLRDRLADPPDDASECTLAVWHDPRFLWARWWSKDGAPRGPQERVAPFWVLLDAAGADVVLHGNAHHYERLVADERRRRPEPPKASRSSSSAPAARASTRSASSRVRNSLEVAQDRSFGALVLDLRPGSLDFRWRGIDGSEGFEDEGTIACH